ncbi:MAG TPA: GAF domain-containing protein, partial [Ktedonobacterales bacterium]|nr:GAF domain-containing protein [Ktedonobacterales bacterium]
NVEAPQRNWFGQDDVLWGGLLATQIAQIAASDELASASLIQTNHVAEGALAMIQWLLPVPATIALMRRVPKSIDRLLISALLPPETMGQFLRLRAGQGITAQVIIDEKPFAGDVGEALTHLISTQSAIVIPIANPDHSPGSSGRPLGVLNIESPVLHGLTMETLQRVTQPEILQELTRLLLAPPTIEQRLDALVDVDASKSEGIYTQILNLVNDYLDMPNLSGAVTLLRDREENLAQVIDLSQWTEDPRWIVVQGTFGAYRTDEPDRRLNRPSITRRVLTDGQPVLLSDVTGDPEYWPLGPSLRSMAAVPIFDREMPIGTIEVLSPQVGAFDEGDIEKLQRVATYVGQL